MFTVIFKKVSIKKASLLSFLFSAAVVTCTFGQATVTQKLYFKTANTLNRVVPTSATAQVTAPLTKQTATITGSGFYNTGSTGSTAGTFSSTTTFTPSGVNRLMLVSVGSVIGANNTVSSVTFGTTTLTKLGQSISGTRKIEYWYLINPSTSADNVTINWPSGQTLEAAVGIVLLSNVDQEEPFGPLASNNGTTSTSILNVTSAPGDIVIETIAVNDNSLTIGSGQTQIFFTGTNSIDIRSSSKPADSGTATQTSMSWSGINASGWSTLGLAIKGVASDVNFVISPALCLDYTIKAGSTITVTAYAKVASGTVSGATIPYHADLTSGGKTIFSSTSAQNSGLSTIGTSGTLTWTGTRSTDTTILAGQLLELQISSDYTDANLEIEFDAVTKASFVSLPSTTYVDVQDIDIYDAAYPGGSIITATSPSSTVYVRSVVSNPFGKYDINRDSIIFSGTSYSLKTLGTKVDSSDCTKTYEYIWTSPATAGNYTIKSKAFSGTEGLVADSLTTTFNLSSDYTITKVVTNPATGPYEVDDIITYRITITSGAATITTLPLIDYFDISCLEYIGASISPNLISNDTIKWNNLGPLAGSSTRIIDTYFRVLANCDPATNTAEVIDAFAGLTALPDIAAPREINIDAPPVANDDDACVTPGTNTIAVLDNDTDADLAGYISANPSLYTVAISAAPSKGTATVNPDKTIDFNTSPGTWIENEYISFSYTVSQAGFPVSTGVVTVQYSGVSEFPTANRDNAAVYTGNSLNIDILSNDVKPEGSYIVPAIQQAPSYGTYTINDDFTITYIPFEGYSGEDTIIYNSCIIGCHLGTRCDTSIVIINVLDAVQVCKQSTSSLINIPVLSDADSYIWTLPLGAVPNASPPATGTGPYETTTNYISVNWTGVAAGTYDVCAQGENECGLGTQLCLKVIVSDVTLSGTPSNVLCFGEKTGAIDLTVTNGLGGYTYTWTGPSGYTASIEDITNLGAGTYNVTVTDQNGCTKSASYTVTQPVSALNATGIVTNAGVYPVNNNGSIDLTPAGGTPGLAPNEYTYQWSNGATTQDISGLGYGIYTVTITDNAGCSLEKVFTVNNIGAPLTSYILKTDVLCSGISTGTIDLEVTGGAINYSYIWSGPGGFSSTSQDLTGLSTGTYNVTINDAGDGGSIAPSSIIASVVIEQPASALAVTSIATNSTCIGFDNGSVNASPVGGTTPYTYLWSTGEVTEDINDLNAGTYTLTVTDANGCSATTTKTITEPTVITLDADVQFAICGDSSGDIDLTVSGGTAPYTFDWSNGSVSEDLTNILADEYAVVVTDANGCTAGQVFVVENSCLGIAKSLVGNPVNNGDGTYTLTYNVVFENLGSVLLDNIQATETLTNTFPAPASYSAVTLTSGDFVVNNLFNGSSNVNLINPNNLGTLSPGSSRFINLSLTVTPGTNLGPYNNSVSASATDPNSQNVSDTSDNGTDTDNDNDGNPNETGDNDPTPVTFTENPVIGLAKELLSGPTNNLDGSYDITFRFKVRNLGDVNLSNIQITDNLLTTFGASSTITNINVNSSDLTVNGAYNGSSNVNLLSGTDPLLINEVNTVDLSFTVIPSSAGPFTNSAQSTGTSPAGIQALDTSDNGSVVDADNDGNANESGENDPTPITFPENPLIGLSKRLIGTPVNHYDGSYSLTYTFTIENSGDVPLSNIQLADNLVTTFGNVPIVITSLASSTFSTNGSYTGIAPNTNLLTGSNTLAVGASGSITLVVRVTPGNLGPFNNSATVTATSPFNAAVSDISQDGSDIDPENDGPADNLVPTPASLTENPEISVAKYISSGPLSNQNGTYTITYAIILSNTGDVVLTNVQLKDTLAKTFTGATGFIVNNVTATGSLAVNSGFTGTLPNVNLLNSVTSTLAFGAIDTVFISLTVTPGANLGPYLNLAEASGESPTGATVTDKSETGTDPDPDGDGDPSNNTTPTPVSFAENPAIEVSKTVGVVTEPFPSTYSFSYTMVLENTGDIRLNNIQLTDDLLAAFPAPNTVTLINPILVSAPSGSGIAINTNFNGNTDKNLLNGTGFLMPGQTVTINLALFVNSPGGGIYTNTVLGLGTSPANQLVMNYDEVDVAFDAQPSIGIAKDVYSVTDIAPPANTTFDIIVELTLENLGNTPLSNLEIYDDIVTQFAGMSPTNFETLIPAAISPTDPAYNFLSGSTGWDGSASSNILAPGQELAIGQTGTVWVKFQVTPGSTGYVDNSATANGTDPTGTEVTDISQDGLNPDPDNDDDGTDNNVPTPITFPIGADLAVTKTVNNPTPNIGGTVIFTIEVENLGPVDATGVELTDILPNGYTFVSASPSAGSYNSGTGIWTIGNLNLNASETLMITATVNQPGVGVIYVNTASVTDSDQNDPVLSNNSDNDTVTPVSSPGISIVKSSSLSKGVDGVPSVGDLITYTYTVSNTGDVTLFSVGVTESVATFTGTGTLPSPVFQSATLSSPDGTLLVSEVATYTATYAITQADINSGRIDNQALASGTSYSGQTVNDNSDTGNTADPNETGGSNDRTATLIDAVDLVIEKSSASETFTPGGTVTWTIVVSNNGPSNVTGATVIDNFVSGLSNISWTAVPSGTASVSNLSGTGNINESVNINAGAANYVTFTITATVASNFTGNLTNSGTVSAPSGFAEINTSNNSDTETDTPLYESDLEITKVSSSSTFTPGGTVTWTITVNNNGPSDVTNAIVSDNFDSRLTDIQWTASASGSASVVNASGNGDIVNELVSIAAGAANYITYTVTADIPSDFNDLTLINTASVEVPAGTTDPDLTNNDDTETDNRQRVADLYVTKTSVSNSYTPGSTVTYTIIAGNNGPSDISAANITDSAPVGTTISVWNAVFSGGSSGNASGSGNINETIELPIGSSITYAITLSVPSNFTGDLTNTATIATTGTDTDPDLSNNSDSETDIQAPIAVNDAFITAYETMINNGSVATNDNYPLNSAFSNISSPSSGTLIFNADGTFDYTPAPGFSGVVTFDYKICLPSPDDSVCDTATVTIVVGPNAVDDNYTTPYETPVTSNVNANDEYPLGSTFTKLTDPANGDVVFSPDGSFIYTPDPGFSGVNTFTYQVCLPSPNGTVCEPATVTIVVGPNAEDDTYITPHNTLITSNVDSNDEFPVGSTFTKLTDPSSGTLNFNADGSFDYTPVAGFSGTVTFTYELCLPSPNGTVCEPATVTIVVGPNADDDNYTTPYETPVTSNVNANDEYPLGSTFTKLTDPTNGDVVFSPDGSFIYTPDPGFSGVNTFTYQVCLPSPNGTVCEPATVTIVVGPNAEDDNEITPFGITLSDHVRANDTYPVNSNFTLINDVPTGEGTLTFNSDGSYTYDPGTFAGTTSFSYSVCMPSPNQGMCDIAIVTITVPCPNVSLAVTSFINPLCEASQTGSITLSVSNGVSPYTYSWPHNPIINSNIATGLYAGTYTITVTDSNGCTDQVSQILVDPSGITATISGVTMVSCAGGSNGSATVTGSGGTGIGTYTYAWSTVPAQTGATATGLTAGSYSVTVTDGNGCSAVAFVVITQPTGMVAQAVEVNAVSCNGASDGSARIDVTGGVTPYSYAWPVSAGSQTTALATGLSAGSYIVTVTDFNLCTTTATAVVSEPAAAVAATGSVVAEVLCRGAATGSASVSVTGGTAPYTYLWSNGSSDQTATNLIAGSYTVTVYDSAGCTDTETVTITQPAAVLTASIGSNYTNPSCEGGLTGSATVTAGGGTPGLSPDPDYTYLWSDGQTGATATGLVAGTYGVTVTDDNGCTAVASVLLSDPTGVVATITSVTQNVCHGGSAGAATVTGSGGVTPYSYTWSHDNGLNSNQATGLAAGNYTVTVTDNGGCSAVAFVIITQPTALLAQIIDKEDVSCNGGNDGIAQVNVTGGVTPYSYAWSTTPSQTGTTATGLAAGSYTVTVTDGNLCTTTVSVTITEPVAGLSISTTVSIDDATCNGGEDGSIGISVSGGTLPYSYVWSNGMNTEDIGNIEAGTYNVTVTDGNGCTAGGGPYVVGQPTAVTASIGSIVQPDCEGGTDGSATVTAGGGTPGVSPNPDYTYLWSNGETTSTAINLTAGTHFVTVTDSEGCTATASVLLTDFTGLEVTVTSVTNNICNGGNLGAATVTVTGGDGPYIYDWTGTPIGEGTASVSGLGAGSYSVTITDSNGCMVVGYVQITQPTLVTAQIISSTNVSCNGGSDGSAIVLGNGGTTGYTYLWSTLPTGQTGSEATGLAAGAYGVTITDGNGCTASTSVTITEPAALTAAGSEVLAVSCRGGSDGVATVGGGGGTAPYTFAWSTGSTDKLQTGLAAGTYGVTVTDARGCTSSTTVTITEPTDALSIVIDDFTNPGCEAGSTGSITVLASGGTGTYTYRWSHNISLNNTVSTGLTAGTYTITVTDSEGCTAEVSRILADPSGITATISGVTMVSCAGGSNGSATVTGSGGTGIGTYTYAWSTVPAQTGATATGLTAGSYSVTVTDGNGCSAVAFVVITQPTGMVAQAVEVNAVSCNGASDGSARIDVTGGVTPYAYNWPGNPIGDGTPRATGLASGDYTVTVTDANLCTTTVLVTIEEGINLQITDINDIGPICKGSEIGDILLESAPFNENISYSWTGGALAGLQDGTASGLNPYIPGFVAVNLNNITATVTVTASLQGCTSSTDFTITILDSTDPTFINCPTSSVTIGTDANCQTGVIWNVPVANDNCDEVTTLQTGGPSYGSELVVGTYQIEYTATDGSGNTEICTFTINIVDDSAPVLVCQEDMTVSVDANNCTWTNNAGELNALLSIDNCPGHVLSYTISGATNISTTIGNVGITALNPGLSTITYTLTDQSSNSISCSFTVFVEDTQAPVIPVAYCNRRYGYVADNNSCVRNQTFDVTGTDNCTDPLSYEIVIKDPTGEYTSYNTAVFNHDYLPGISEVTVNITDGNGNRSTCRFTVSVRDAQLPQITCASISPIYLNTPGICGFEVPGQIFDPIASDNCSEINVTHNYYYWGNPSSLSGATFGVGVTTVTWTVTDDAGNVASCDIEISVEDNEAPSFINCPPSGTIFTVGQFTNDCNSGAIWNIPLASDNCGVSVLQTLGPLPGTILGVGLYNIQYTASDLAGNTAVCNFGIQVIDTEDPIIVCPGNILINHTNITECTWESPIGSLTPLLVNSNCPSLVSWSITNPDATINTGLGDASGYIFELGTSNVVYRITEPASGQFWTCSFNVIVTDNTPPTIICPEDLTIECGDTQQSQKIEDWIETATLLDACDNTLNVQASIFSTDSKCGATQTLLYRFVTVDDAGNSSECFANVHIVDTTSPQISGGNDVAINDCTDPNFGNYPEFDFWLTSHAGATATDLCGNVTWSNNYNPVNWVEQCGITKYVDVIFTAKDECGNLSSTTKRFSIGDTEAPTFINCPRPPIIEYAPEGWAATFVNYAPMLATDNCGGVIITQIDGTGYSSGSLFPVGLTTLIFEAEDDCGNTSRCQLQIVVNDYHTPPSFSCGQDITVSTDPQECFATLNNLPPLNITDNAIQNVTAVYGIEHAGEVIASGINVANGNQFPKGVSTVTYRVKDQVLLKITEVIHNGTVSGVEITNFGPAKYDISFLNIERIGFSPESFIVPNGIILNVGDTYTHNFSAIPAGIPIAYQISFLNNLIDGVALNGYVPTTFSWSGQINGNYAIRTRILDLDNAQDFEVTTLCDNGNYGLLNPGIPTYNWNGTTTSLQSEEPSEITCTFRVTVLDQELPFCAQYDTLRYQGISGAILSTQCNTSSVQINSHFEIGDINIKNLNGSYPDMGDITVQLVSPSGKKVKLLDRMCTGTQNFNINLDDESLQLLSGTGCNPLGQGGTFRPLESMKTYLGEDAFGTWTIEIYSAGNQSGSIDGWTLEILEVESFQQQNVTIPNILDRCGASYTWNHALVGDNCFEGTIRVDYSTLDGISVPVGQTLSGKGGYINTQYFQVGTTTVTYTVTDAAGLVSTCSFDVTVEDVQDPVILTGTCEDISINLPPGDCYASYIYPTASFTDNCSGAFATYSIPSGSDFGIGQTVVTATIQDLAGNFVTCQFVVEVIEFTPTNSTMVCNGEVNLSLDKNCMAWLNADMFLEGDHYRCYDSYCIIIKDQLGNIIGSSANNTHFFDLSHVGKSFYVSVCESCDIQNSNCCWSLVNIEEKLIPEVECPEDITIQCNGSQDPSATGYPELMTCEPDISISYIDEYIDGEACNNPRAIINRLWIIKDEAGHEVQCNQNIVVMPFNLNMVEFPDDLVLSEALSCVDVEADPSLTTPANTGYPTIQGQDLYGEHLCEFNVGFRDEVLDDANCLNGYEILRHWSIRNECQPLQEGVNPKRHIQAIKVNDKSSPVFKNCPDDITINTLPYACTGQYLLENVSEMAEDACGDIKKIQVNLTGGSVSKPSNGQDDYMLFNMEVGHHNVRIRVFDACKNVATCNFNIYVKDETAPYAIGDQLLTVSLIPLPDGTSQARLNAISVDDGSYDNCGEVKFEIRREAGSPACGNVSNQNINVNNNWTFNNNFPIIHENDHVEDTDGGDYVTFCCQDLFTGVDMDGDGSIDTGYHRVYLRVWDDGDQNGIFGSEGDQFNEVQAYVRVENKIPPIVRCPADATINCDSNPFIFETLTVIQNQDLSLTGIPQVVSLCGDAILRVLDSKSINNCGIGFITRRFTVNQGSYTHQCTQRITMEIPSSHTPWSVFAPPVNAVEVGCNGPTLDEIATYGPTWVGGPCDNIGITHTVNTFFFDGQSCKKWLVEYSLINWCNNELRGPYQRVFVHKDTIAPVIQQCSDRQFQAGENCAIQNLTLKNIATDNVSCNSTDQIKWVVTIDINNDGIKDFEWSSYLTPGDDVQDAINGNINLISDDNGNGIPDIYVAPTASGSEVSIQLPVALQASIQSHQIDWRATDGCNNTSACQHQIFVTDQKAPTAICSSISTAFMRDPDGNGPLLSMVELKAKSFDQGSNDQCTPANQLYFTFEQIAPQDANKLVFGNLININVPHYFDRSGGLLKYPADLTDPAQSQIVQNYLNGTPASPGNGKVQLWNPNEKTSSMVWTISELPTGTGVLTTTARMTVWDASLNKEFCATNLRITCQDCPGFLLAELSGSARTVAMNGVKNVYVITEGINVPELITNTQTDSTGYFAIDVPKGVSYKLSALKNGNYMEGVSTLDLVLISRHMLGIDTFESPFKVIASDIDNNNKVNSADLVMLRKLILGLVDQLPNLPWRLPVRQQNLDMFEPFPYQEYIIIDSLSQPIDDNHFVAVKIGDVNGSAKTDIIGVTAEPRNNHALILKMEDKLVDAGETIYIPVTSDNYRGVMGHQFTMDLNHATFEGLLPGALEISNSQFGKINTQKVTFSYDDAFGTTLPSDQTLFTLILKVQKNANLSEMVRITSEITSAEAYFEGLSVVSPLRLVWEKAPLVSKEIILHQNEPNPFVTSTSIGFEIPMDGQVTLNIYSMQGQLIHSRQIDARKGLNTEVFTAEQIGDSGFYYYELSAFNKKLGRKLIRIE